MAAVDYAKLMEPVCRILLGEPNKNSTKTNLRYGTNGSLSIDLKKGAFRDWESGTGGGVLDLINRVTGLDGAGCHDWLREHGFTESENRSRSNGKRKPPHVNGEAKGNGRGHDDAVAEAEREAARADFAADPPAEDDAARKLAIAKRIAARSKPIKGTPTEAYLKRRGISIDRLSAEMLQDLRFCPAQGKYPAMMVALVRNVATGELTGSIHRTPITADGARATEEVVLEGGTREAREMPKKGLGEHGEHGMVLIGQMPQEGPVLVSEGIEDALTGSMVLGMPAVATLSMGRLKRIPLPAGVQPVMLAQKKKIADQVGWIEAAKHHSAKGHDVEVAWPGAHGDFNEMLQKDGADAVEKVLGEAETIAAKPVKPEEPSTQTAEGQPTSSPLEVCDGDDDSWIPPREFLLGTTFCRQFTSMLQAPGGIGKTSVRIAQAIAVASGRPITGEHVFQRCRVLVICLEDDINELRRRIRACRKHHDIDSLKGWLFYCAPGGRSGKLMIGEGAKREPGDLAGHIVDQIRKLKIDLVIIDPLKKAHGVNENNNSDMDEVMDLVTSIAVEHNVAVDLPHHTAKGTPEAGNAEKGRGASATKDAARLVKTLTAMTPEEAAAFALKADDRRRYVRYDYAKDNIAPAGDTKWFKLVNVQLGNATDLYPSGDSVQAIETWTPPNAWSGMNSSLANRILDAIQAGMPNGERYSDASKATARAAWQVVSKFTGKEEGPSREIVRTWVKNGVLRREQYTSPTRREPQTGLIVDPAKRPGP
jgi:hypothetical protein